MCVSSCSIFKDLYIDLFYITNESDDGFEDEIESYVIGKSCGSKVLDLI